MRLLRAFAWLVAGVVAIATLALSSCRAAAALRESTAREVAAPETGRFITAGDVRVFVQEAGPADGPAVLLIHGTGAWSEIWRETMRALAAAGFRAIAMDMPPFGYSERPGGARYNDEAQALRILGVLDGLGLGTATLIGHSFGGRPTVEATFIAPQRVTALVLIDAALDLHPPADGSEQPQPAMTTVLSVAPLRNAIVASTITNPALSKRLLLTLIANDAAATDERVRMFQRPFAVAGTTPAVGAWLVSFLTTRERSRSTEQQRYRGLAMPTLVIWGARDDLTPLAQGRELAALIPGAELVVLPTAGHIPAIEDPAGVNAALVAFLQKRVSTP